MRVRCILAAIGASGLLAAPAGARSLTFEERVDAELALQAVYDRHRQEPASSPRAREPFEIRIRRDAVAAKVEAQLARSALRDSRWDDPVTAAEVQKELHRMVRSSRSPEVLEELIRALHHDPLLVAECLVRPVLVAQRFDEHVSADPFRARLRAARGHGGAGSVSGAAVRGHGSSPVLARPILAGCTVSV